MFRQISIIIFAKRGKLIFLEYVDCAKLCDKHFHRYCSVFLCIKLWVGISFCFTAQELDLKLICLATLFNVMNLSFLFIKWVNNMFFIDVWHTGCMKITHSKDSRKWLHWIFFFFTNMLTSIFPLQIPWQGKSNAISHLNGWSLWSANQLIWSSWPELSWA